MPLPSKVAKDKGSLLCNQGVSLQGAFSKPSEDLGIGSDSARNGCPLSVLEMGLVMADST